MVNTKSNGCPSEQQRRLSESDQDKIRKLLEPMDSALLHARDMCRELHAGQKRKDGSPYHLHPEAVAAALDLADAPTHVIEAGYLHDVIEDQGQTVESLTSNGVSKEAAELVWVVSRRDDPETGRKETYDDFIGRILENPLACLLKLADVLHNKTGCDLLEGGGSLLRRYEKAEAKLKIRLNFYKEMAADKEIQAP